MIRLDHVSIHAGEFFLKDVCVEIPTGAYGVLMGRTGSGKTTLLETVLGLRRLKSGRIWLNGHDVTQFKPAVRGVGYVPQDGALFSTMTVRDQIGFAMTIRNETTQAIAARVDELAEVLGISHLLDRMPTGLSGGERQRIALGRALSFKPTVLCLDEPLSALDSETRDQMCQLLTDVHRAFRITALHVTHNLNEAERLADLVFRIEDGVVQQSE